ncbi:MAG TPA: ABC transporter permease subunit [Acidimicrobiia bacterium]|nr:ABC transporter permease subunit [Acidimicrobiia bacterium]
MATATARAPFAPRAWLPWLALLVAVIVVQLAFAATEAFPESWNIGLHDPIDAFNSWARTNQGHPLFTSFLDPISAAIGWGLRGVVDVLLWLPWFVLPGLVFFVIARTGHLWVAALAALGMTYPGMVGMWDTSMETLALMAVAVIACVVIGIPIGIWAALSPRVEQAIRPILDAMQVVPAPVYLIPMILFFGTRLVPAAVATVIYAIPPVIRMTTLGIGQVPGETVEAAQIFGSTRRQILTKVQLPLAGPSIMAGINQTIMMALGIVVIASLIGAGGLGQDVLESLQVRSPGRGLMAGLAIVVLAMVLDRVGRTFIDRSSPGVERAGLGWWGWGLLAVLSAGIVAGFLGVAGFPEGWQFSFAAPVDTAVIWVRDTFYPFTTAFNDFLVASVLIPVQSFLETTMVWPALLILVAWLAWQARGWGLAVFSAAGLLVIGLVGMWAFSIDTLVQTMAAVILSLAIAIPLGVWAGLNRRVEQALAPLLDALQTIPSFVYIIPVVMLFTVGRVPGIIASVLYAIAPGIRLTALGIKNVSTETVEASEAFGATERQTLWKVRIPLAAPTIMAGVNQVIMMVLAMVIIAGMVGGGGLGFEAVRALTRSEVGLGIEVGIAIVIMAMILDRLTEAAADRSRPVAPESA